MEIILTLATHSPFRLSCSSLQRTSFYVLTKLTIVSAYSADFPFWVSEKSECFVGQLDRWSQHIS